MAPPFLLLVLAACGSDAERPTPPVQTAELTGLYEGPAAGPERSRLCMLADGAAGQAPFGVVVVSPSGELCSGAGRAMRKGETVRLEMAGDEACAIEARLNGTALAFPAAVPEGCAYYCGPGGSLRSATFTKTGGTAADALEARDLAGDALCG